MASELTIDCDAHFPVGESEGYEIPKEVLGVGLPLYCGYAASIQLYVASRDLVLYVHLTGTLASISTCILSVMCNMEMGRKANSE